MYQGRDLAAAEERLRSFLIYRFGGPATYIEERGHPRLRMRHAPFAVNQAARDHWLKLMGEALAETAMPARSEGCSGRVLSIDGRVSGEPRQLVPNYLSAAGSTVILSISCAFGPSPLLLYF